MGSRTKKLFLSCGRYKARNTYIRIGLPMRRVGDNSKREVTEHYHSPSSVPVNKAPHNSQTNKAYAISRRIRHFITMINIPHFASVNNLFLILMWLEGEFERFEVNFPTRAAINISKFIHTFHCCYIGVGGEQIIMKRGKF